MTANVYYQDGMLTITDKVIVTKDNTYELSAVSGLSYQVQIRHILLSILLVIVLFDSIRKDISNGIDPGFAIVAALIGIGALYGFLSLFPTRKLIAFLAGGSKATLVAAIRGGRARAIMHAFTLAKAGA